LAQTEACARGPSTMMSGSTEESITGQARSKQPGVSLSGQQHSSQARAETKQYSHLKRSGSAASCMHGSTAVSSDKETSCKHRRHQGLTPTPSGFLAVVLPLLPAGLRSTSQ
jgi:hypothetical protein